MSLTSIRAFRPPSGVLARLALVVVLSVAVGVIAKILIIDRGAVKSRPQPARSFLPSSGLAMHADDQGERILLSWNRDNATVRSSTGGVLHISDGGRRRDVQLDSSIIAGGSVLYRPGSNDISFQLEVSGAGGDFIAGNLMVLDGGQTSSDVANQNDPRRITPLATVVSVTVPRSYVNQNVKPPPQDTPVISQDTIRADATPHSEGVNGPAAAASGTESEREPALVSPPVATTQVSETADAHLVAQISQLPAAPSPGPLAAPVRPPVTAVVPADIAPDASSISDARISSDIAATFVPAKPLRQVMPNLRQFGVAKNVSNGVEVEVIVKVNDKGRVVGATLVESGAGAPRYIAFAALNAAKQWTFQPATLRGKDIPSDHHLVFKFGPGPK